ncbi:MAG: sulfotransferase [Bradymonadaceae bacterium]
MLPDFVILGAPRCGTTSLARVLGEHPEAYVPGVKEIGFFQAQKHWSRGLEWYESFFEKAPETARICGEATPYYLQSEKAAERIADVLPEARLITIVRDPVERARSHFFLRRRLGDETRSFREAVEEAVRSQDDPDYFLNQGLYSRGLKHYTERFGSNQLEVVVFERLVADQQEELANLQSFLGLTPVDLELPKANESRRPRSEWFQRAWKRLISFSGPVKALVRKMTTRSLRKRIYRGIRELNLKSADKPPMQASTRRLLRDYFADETDRVRKILDDDLSEWQSDTSQ